jgi:hypothetical protein
MVNLAIFAVIDHFLLTVAAAFNDPFAAAKVPATGLKFNSLPTI